MTDITTDISHHGISSVVSDALQTYASIVGGSPPRITGLYIVGSCLTENFTPNESDLDLYIETTNPYEYDDGFISLLNDPDEPWNSYLQEHITISITTVDVLGLVQSDARIRDPYQYIPIN